MDAEKMILGAWLTGEHLDDMKLFSPSDFKFFPQVASEVMHGFNIYEIASKLRIKIDELYEMTRLYRPIFYWQAINVLTKTKIQKIVSKTEGTVQEIADQINELASACNIEPLPEPATDLAANYIEELGERMSVEPVKYDLVDLDEKMGGIRRKELTTIGARPSVGKSAFLLQIAVSIANQGQKVLYFPLEMSTIQTVERIIQSNSIISQSHLRSGRLTDEEWQKISIVSNEVIDKLDKSGNFLIFEGANNLSNIKRLIKEHEPFVVIIDQLTQLRDNRTFKDKREQFSYMTNELKRISMESDVAVLLAAQVNRSAQEELPTMANLKESGSIEEDSDNIILLHRVPLDKVSEDKRYKFNDSVRPMCVNIAKQRGGETGMFKMIFNARRFQFYGAEEELF